MVNENDTFTPPPSTEIPIVKRKGTKVYAQLPLSVDINVEQKELTLTSDAKTSPNKELEEYLSKQVVMIRFDKPAERWMEYPLSFHNGEVEVLISKAIPTREEQFCLFAPLKDMIVKKPFEWGKEQLALEKKPQSTSQDINYELENLEYLFKQTLKQDHIKYAPHFRLGIKDLLQGVSSELDKSGDYYRMETTQKIRHFIEAYGELLKCIEPLFPMKDTLSIEEFCQALITALWMNDPSKKYQESLLLNETFVLNFLESLGNSLYKFDSPLDRLDSGIFTHCVQPFKSTDLHESKVGSELSCSISNIKMGGLKDRDIIIENLKKFFIAFKESTSVLAQKHTKDSRLAFNDHDEFWKKGIRFYSTWICPLHLESFASFGDLILHTILFDTILPKVRPLSYRLYSLADEYVKGDRNYKAYFGPKGIDPQTPSFEATEKDLVAILKKHKAIFMHHFTVFGRYFDILSIGGNKLNGIKIRYYPESLNIDKNAPHKYLIYRERIINLDNAYSETWNALFNIQDPNHDYFGSIKVKNVPKGLYPLFKKEAHTSIPFNYDTEHPETFDGPNLVIAVDSKYTIIVNLALTFNSSQNLHQIDRDFILTTLDYHRDLGKYMNQYDEEMLREEIFIN